MSGIKKEGRNLKKQRARKLQWEVQKAISYKKRTICSMGKSGNRNKFLKMCSNEFPSYSHAVNLQKGSNSVMLFSMPLIQYCLNSFQ